MEEGGMRVELGREAKLMLIEGLLPNGKEFSELEKAMLREVELTC